jgi:microcystin-dependent protein
MTAPLIGEIRMFAGRFEPRGWALCDGRLLSISRHSALFSVVGTAYGGDGMTNFALPDLRERVPRHSHPGPEPSFIIALEGDFPARG